MAKGHTNNPHGRPKGKPNKVTGSMREKIDMLLQSRWETLENDLMQLTPKERTDAFIKLLPYVLPKQNEVIVDEHPHVMPYEQFLHHIRSSASRVENAAEE